MDELWKQAIKDITDGSYSRVEKVLGGGDAFDNQILDWFNRGYFENEPEALAETVTCASFLGRSKVVAHLLDNGVRPCCGYAVWDEWFSLRRLVWSTRSRQSDD